VGNPLSLFQTNKTGGKLMGRFTERTPFVRNMQQINLEDTRDERVGDQNLYPTVLDSSADKIARCLVALAKSGEDMSELTPEKVFGKNTNQSCQQDSR